MVRGNWQKRVERAETRREETRQRKISNGNKGKFKSLVQNQFLPLIDRYTLDSPDRNNKKPNKLYLWLDTPPLSFQNSNKFKDDDDDRNSFKHINSARKKSHREFGNRNTSKKLHPRSHDHGNDEKVDHEDESQQLLLCSNHFFNGTCDCFVATKTSKKSAKQPRLFHYEKKRQMTLANALLCKTNSGDKSLENINNDKDITTKDILKRSSEAAVASFTNSLRTSSDESDIIMNAMDMVYFLEVELSSSVIDQNKNIEEKDDIQCNNTTLSNQVVSALVSEQCPIGSIAFAVISETLIFDRFNGGVLEGSIESLNGVFEGTTSTTLGDASKIADGINNSFLPVAVLEHILGFLPEESTGFFSMVCKDWNREIGKMSPALWQLLLKRRNWPDQIIQIEVGKISSLIDETKKLYVSHYGICKSINTLIDGMSNVRSGVEPEFRNTFAFQSFQDTKDDLNDIISFKHFNESTLIAGCASECNLRIYEAMKNDTTGNLLCKQIVSVRTAPFPHSRKRKCLLTSMDLDDEYILCCFQVRWLCNWITLVRKEEILLNSTETNLDSDVLKRFDLNSLMVTYCKSENLSNSMDDVVERFVTDGNAIEDMATSVHGRIVACQNGIFMFIANIFIPDDDDDDINDSAITMIQIARVIVQFSAKREAITWCNVISHEMEPINTNTVLSSYNPMTQTLICTSTPSSPIIYMQVERRRGTVSIDTFKDFSRQWQDSLRQSGWGNSAFTTEIVTAVSQKYIILSGALRKDETEDSCVVVFLLPIEKNENENMSLIVLDNFQRVESMHVYGDYLLILCGLETEDHDAFDGHWFGEEDRKQLAYLIVVHIPSKVEIHRRCITRQIALEERDFCKVLFAASHVPTSTFFAIEGNLGVFMSGEVLRNIESPISSEKSKGSVKKKIKKKGPPQTRNRSCKQCR